MLLAPDLAPITTAFGLLAAPLHRVVANVRAWKLEIDDHATLTEVSAGLREGLRRLEPLGAPWFKRLWIQTTSKRWGTAYFDGSINGGDPFPPVSYLARRMKCLGLVIVAASNSVQIHEYGADQTEWLNLNWAVVAAKDDPWYWHHFGETRDFEETENYAKRRIKDRFTIEMLRRYCAALDVPLEESGYGLDAIIESPKIPRGQHRFETLSEARRRLGLE